ncbi:hypothetical protein HDU97_000142 [Phlyctochytrium planicorne]|nr:hypothetical protein HDU97_000142 [Phlyctochytrium planicorne]
MTSEIPEVPLDDSKDHAWVDMMEAAFDSSLALDEQAASDAQSEESAPSGIEIITNYDATSRYFAGTIIVNGSTIVLADGEVEEAINIFFEINQKMPVPFMHEHTVRSGILSLTPSNTTYLSILFAVVCIAAASGQSDDGSKWPFPSLIGLREMARSEECFHAAIGVMDIDKPSLEMLQTLLVLVIYCGFVSNRKAGLGWLMSGMATRLVPILRLDVDPDVLESESGRSWTTLEKETRRRVFWLTIMIDMMDMIFREKSSGIWHTTQPVKPPLSVAIWFTIGESGEPATHVQQQPPAADVVGHVIRLMEIICKVIEYHVTKEGTTLGVQGVIAQVRQPLLAPTEKDQTLKNEVMVPIANGIESTALALDQPFVSDWSQIHHPSPVVTDLWSPLSPPDASMPDAEFVQLDQELTAWRQALPAWMRIDGRSQFRIGATEKDGVASYLLPKVFLYSSACTLTLHRPFLVRSVAGMIQELRKSGFRIEGGDDGAEPLDPLQRLMLIMPAPFHAYHLESLKSSTDAATSIISFLDRPVEIVGPSPMVSGVHPAASFFGIGEARAILEAALHYVIVYALVKDGRWGGVMEAFLGIGKEQAMRGVRVAREVLVAISRQWSVASYMVKMVERLETGVGIPVHS